LAKVDVVTPSRKIQFRGGSGGDRASRSPTNHHRHPFVLVPQSPKTRPVTTATRREQSPSLKWKHPQQRHGQRKVAEGEDIRIDIGHSTTTGLNLMVDQRSREHVEIKACMLAHTHRLDVQELENVGKRHRAKICLMQDQRKALMTSETTYFLEAARRKTQFLLDHYLCMASTQQCAM
jgi:hypothetical protein